MDVLVVRGPIFHSRGDEDAFFWWLKRIRLVSGVSNRGADIHIQLRPGKVSKDEVRELRSLFMRYALDSTDLGELERR